MKLTARVVKVESGQSYTDKRQRITLEFAEAASFDNKLTIPQDDKQSFKLDDEVTVWVYEPNQQPQQENKYPSGLKDYAIGSPIPANSKVDF